jgi:hypothetical protein
MPEFFDRQGQPLEVLEWAKKYEDISYQSVAVDVDDLDSPHIMVSTIWEGMNRPLSLFPETTARGIFETAVLVDGVIQDRWRWDTEEQALEGHDNWCVTYLQRHADDGTVRRIILERKEARRGRRD